MSLSTPRSVEYFANATFVVGILPTVLGINAVLRPASALSLVGVSQPSQPQDQKLAHFLIQMYGARNIAVGLLALLLWSRGERRTLGLGMFAMMPIALIDGFASRMQLGRGEWGYWFFVPVGAILGAGSLGWF
ncbi:hypothetical protein AB5N19_00515 [Seiridium cardinale]